MFFKKKNEIKNYNLEMTKTDFVNTMSIVQNFSSVLKKESDGYYLYSDVFHNLYYRYKESELRFNVFLKTPISLPFEKLEGIDILYPESKEKKAIIKFEEAEIVVIESYGLFYQLVKMVKKASGQEIETASGNIDSYPLTEQGFEDITKKYRHSDEGDKEKEWNLQKFKDGFIKRKFMIDKYNWIQNYRKKVKHYFN